jgi:choline dehydrogenase-like flavoprotein
VCFNTPDTVLSGWNENAATRAGIDVDAYRRAQEDMRRRMRIEPLTKSTTTRKPDDVLNPGDGMIAAGVEKYIRHTGKDLEFDVVSANIADCLGCGYCNIGCSYGRKLSMLDTVLPAAQEASNGRLRIVSEAEVDRIVTEGTRVRSLEVKMRDGRRFSVERPNAVVLSAGAVASSWLLMRSGIGRGTLPVGRHLCFNMGSPLHGLWNEKLNSYAGLQISHYLRPREEEAFVFETWYNPPVAQALAMPGWLDTHFRNMSNYAKIAAIGILVGSEPTAHIKPALLLRGMPDIVYTPTERDMNTLVDAMVLMGHVMVEGGAESVFASTRHYRSFEQGKAMFHRDRIASLDEGLRRLVKDERDILLGTGHPQGGNRISEMRGQNGDDGGVIDPDFKVWGYDNLFVCDASVFPGATTVNPQLSVMTMARYASDRIAQHIGR